MTAQDWQLIYTVCSVAVCFGTFGIWLEKRFNKTETTLFAALSQHKHEDNLKFEKHGERILTLELQMWPDRRPKV